MARKDNAAAERYYQQTPRMDSEKYLMPLSPAVAAVPPRLSLFLPPASGAVSTISNAVRENDRLAQQAETLESEGAQAAELHRRRLA